MQISFAPSTLARSELCPWSMPVEKTTAAARANTGASFRSLVMTVIPLPRNTRGGRRHSARRHSFRHRANRQNGLPVRHQRQKRAEHDDSPAKPYPLHQRIEIRVNDGLLRIRAASRVDDVEIFLERRVDGHHGARFLVGWIEAPLGI